MGLRLFAYLAVLLITVASASSGTCGGEVSKVDLDAESSYQLIREYVEYSREEGVVAPIYGWKEVSSRSHSLPFLLARRDFVAADGALHSWLMEHEEYRELYGAAQREELTSKGWKVAKREIFGELATDPEYRHLRSARDQQLVESNARILEEISRQYQAAAEPVPVDWVPEKHLLAFASELVSAEAPDGLPPGPAESYVLAKRYIEYCRENQVLPALEDSNPVFNQLISNDIELIDARIALLQSMERFESFWDSAEDNSGDSREVKAETSYESIEQQQFEYRLLAWSKVLSDLASREQVVPTEWIPHELLVVLQTAE